MAELFGYSISDRLKQKSNNVVSPIPPNSDDSTTPIAGNYYGLTLNLNDNSKDEQSLILRYRDLAVDPTVDAALDDIINEAIATDLDKVPLNINLSNLKISDNLKAVIREEFKYITKLLNFEQKGHSIFRRWLVDGKLFYHKLIDIKSPKDGIQELRYIDPLKIKLVTQKIKSNQQNTVFTQNEFLDYYLYSENGFYTSGNKVQQTYNGTKNKQLNLLKMQFVMYHLD